MAPFHMPWSSFGAFFLLAAAIVLALVWAGRDRARERRDEASRAGGHAKPDRPGSAGGRPPAPGAGGR